MNFNSFRKEETIWICWQNHRRTETICSALGVSLYPLTTNKKGLCRYVLHCFQTLVLLFRVKPKNLIVQNPSVVLCVLACILKFFFRFKLLIDAHNEGVEPYENVGFLISKVTLWLHRKADITIVTNKYLYNIVVENGGSAIILPDGLPDLNEDIDEGIDEGGFSKGVKMVLIATYAKDEPVEEVLSAFGMLAGNLSLYVTGDHKKLDNKIKRNLPENIYLTGFLSEESYVGLLKSSRIIIDLTRMPACLVCGAYEAISLEKPVLLANDQACRELFETGAVFTDLDNNSIYKAMINMIDSLNELDKQAKEMKKIYRKRWEGWLERLMKEL